MSIFSLCNFLKASSSVEVATYLDCHRIPVVQNIMETCERACSVADIQE